MLQKRLLLLVLAIVAAGVLSGCQPSAESSQPPPADLIHHPDYPQRVILTWNGDPARTQAVTWHTGAHEGTAFAEIAPADASPNFGHYARRVEAATETVPEEPGSGYFHSATFTHLEPDTLYAYRVGDGETWSAWYQFRTAADEPRAFSFIYLGDAQNRILSMWSRVIREAYADMPRARFIVHAGDLVNKANSQREWAEWFEAGGWIHATIPAVAVTGNHEFWRDENKHRHRSRFWRPHFTFPEHGPEGHKETAYYVDFQGVRVIGLESVFDPDSQAEWLERVLADNPNDWTFVTFHHPLYATRKDRDNDELRSKWKPILDKYDVDMVLQGHDHAYGRGHNLPTGRRRHSDAAGTVYVVSVSGPKMYNANDEADWMDRLAENTQLYQVISIDGRLLRYRAMTASGELYDAFDLVKEGGRPTRLIERMPPGAPTRTKANTLPQPLKPGD